MNVPLRIVGRFAPEFLKKKELEKLLAVVAAAFKSDIPSITSLSFDESLQTFADKTEREAARAVADGRDLAAIKNELYRGAFEIGERLRNVFRVSTIPDAMAVGRVIYRHLGITFHGTQSGNVVIPQCYFSRLYSSSTCRIISSLDEGMMAGLSGGKAFVFSQRMTEGFTTCRGHFILKDGTIEKSDRGRYRCWWCNRG
ncbi:MAG TPA: hypothetical protein VMM58_02655 [Bacteroidota bacterium]|nr:hypothetical protein [Bacteroidota bacterium]